MSSQTTKARTGKFYVGNQVTMAGSSSGKVIAIVPAGENPHRVLSRYCDETGTYLHLPNGSVRDHEAYLVQVSDTLCRFPEVKTISLDTMATSLFQEMDKRRQDSFKVEVVKDKTPYTGGQSQEALSLRVTCNGVEWKSLRILSREIRPIVDALLKAEEQYISRRVEDSPSDTSQDRPTTHGSISAAQARRDPSRKLVSYRNRKVAV